MFHLRAALFVLFVFCVSARAQPADPDKVMTVCEILREPSRYNGKKVAIRGEYLIWGHGVYLRGEECSSVELPKGREWAAVVDILLWQDEIQRRGFNPEQIYKAIGEIDLVMERSEPTRKSEEVRRVTLTLVGTFDTRDRFDGQTGGFGDGGGAPAQMIVDSVRDIVVTYDKKVESLPKK